MPSVLESTPIVADPPPDRFRRDSAVEEMYRPSVHLPLHRLPPALPDPQRTAVCIVNHSFLLINGIHDC